MQWGSPKGIKMGFTWRARDLVPPKFTSGGSYPMLNSIDVRPSVRQIGDYLRAGTAFLQLLLRWVFGAPQSAALVPPKFTSGGYYLMLNSIDVRPSVI